MYALSAGLLSFAAATLTRRVEMALRPLPISDRESVLGSTACRRSHCTEPSGRVDKTASKSRTIPELPTEKLLGMPVMTVR